MNKEDSIMIRGDNSIKNRALNQKLISPTPINSEAIVKAGGKAKKTYSIVLFPFPFNRL